MTFTQNLQNVAVAEDKWIGHLIDRVNALEGDACAELNQIKADAFDYIQKKLAQLEKGGGQSAIVKALLSVPTDLNSAIQWIENAITVLIGPYVTALETNIAQIAAIVGQIARLTSAIESAAGRLVECTVSIPSIPVTVPPPFNPGGS